MTVGQLEARLKMYPRDAKVVILVTAKESQLGVDLKEDLMPTYIRPDVETVPSSIFLVPEYELMVKA